MDKVHKYIIRSFTCFFFLISIWWITRISDFRTGAEDIIYLIISCVTIFEILLCALILSKKHVAYEWRLFVFSICVLSPALISLGFAVFAIFIAHGGGNDSMLIFGLFFIVFLLTIPIILANIVPSGTPHGNIENNYKNFTLLHKMIHKQVN